MSRKTITIDELRSSFSNEHPEDVSTTVTSTTTSSKAQMKGPSSSVPRVELSNKHVKSINVAKIGGLLLCAIVLQFLLNTQYVKAYTYKYIGNPLMAKLVTMLLFVVVIGTLFFFTVIS